MHVNANIFIHEIDYLISRICPIESANTRRENAFRFVSELICSYISSHEKKIIMCIVGSSSQQTYLPESDIDLCLIAVQNSRSNKSSKVNINTSVVIDVFHALCSAIDDDIDDNLDSNTSVPATQSEILPQQNLVVSNYHHSYRYDINRKIRYNDSFTIRNIEFINARTKLINCKVNNLNIDVTLNQIGTIASTLLVEEADALLGCNHILKRSIILIKAWGYHESSQYCGKCILGAKDSMLSSYALTVMILYVFNLFPLDQLTHPFYVLRAFLFSYSNNQFWQSDMVLSLSCGITSSKQYEAIKKSRQIHAPYFNRFESIQANIYLHISKLIQAQSMQKIKSKLQFPFRPCNIEDPVNPYNNLGIIIFS